MKIYKQKRIDISTLAGLKKAEWYKSHGCELPQKWFPTKLNF